MVALGTGGALSVLGVAAVAARESTVSEYNADTTCPPFDAPSRPAHCADRVSTAGTWRTVSILGFGLGALGIVGGIVLLVTAPGAPRTTSSSCGPGPGALGLACRFLF